MNNLLSHDQKMWKLFADHEQLAEQQLDMFQQYARLLLAWNTKINLTAITDLKRIVADHFQDSLALAKVINLAQISSVADVGSGAGFPGIPLAIRYSDLSVMLIEVNQKKIQFLHEVITTLALTNVSISEYDWRTFLRKTDYPIQLFCARASLQPEELIRMFNSSSPYRDAQLVYWASEQWSPGTRVAPFMVRDLPYRVDHKMRRLIVMRKPL